MEGKRVRNSNEEVSSVSNHPRSVMEIFITWREDIDALDHSDVEIIMPVFKEAFDRCLEYILTIPYNRDFYKIPPGYFKIESEQDKVISIIMYSVQYGIPWLDNAHARRLNFLDPKKILLIKVPDNVPGIIRAWIRDAYENTDDPTFLEKIPFYEGYNKKTELDVFISHVTRVLSMTPDEIDMDETIPYKDLVVAVSNAVYSGDCWLRAERDTDLINLETLRSSNRIDFGYLYEELRKIRN